MESVYAAFQRLRSLPFRGGAAAAAEGIMIVPLTLQGGFIREQKLLSRQDSRAKQVY